ncbi:MAG: molybdopterin converting factor subunit 1 [Deltaproteobacteria bacterium]|jgi:molybdopterin synthase catalytic subunit
MSATPVLTVSVLYFGLVKEKLGMDRETLEVAAGTGVDELMRELAERHGIEDLGAGSLRVAVNLEYVESSRVLAEGDEVAIIPPVAGG